LKQAYKAGLVLLSVMLITACTTQKRKGELSGLGKLYHNTTAHYNGYFNANELVNGSLISLADQHQDNYNQLLEVYPYIAASNPQAAAADLDQAVEKVATVVSLHRYSQWTDDCYLLVGKAQFLKKDYESAESTLRYLLDEYSPDKLKKKSKKVKKGSSSSASASKSGSKAKSNPKEAKKEKIDKVKEQAKKRKEANRQAKKNKKKKSSSSKGKKTPPKTTITSSGEPKSNTPVEPVAPVSKAPELITLADDTPADGNPDNYFLKHRPAYQEAQLWLAKTYVERDNFDGAQRILSQLENDPETFQDVRAELGGVGAYLHIKRKAYGVATGYLGKAIELSSDKETKARFAYILGQLFQRLGNGEAAYAAFERSLKYSTDYEMSFSSRLNMAQNAWLSGKGNATDARASLEKLLKDPKNVDYVDQIYYALAEIDLKEGKREDAIKNLTLSLSSSRKNRAQKAESYLKLANLYYEVEDYVPAKAYFDSTLQVMASTDERYSNVSKLSNSLTDIAANIQIIQLQDSLLRLASMTGAEKRDLANKLRREQDEARRNAAAAVFAQQPVQDPPGSKQAITGSPQPALQKESTFFAYDDRSAKRGKRDFETKWGQRKLEDNWRRSNRRISSEFVEEGAPVAETISNAPLTEEEVDKLLVGIPKTDAQKGEANLKIREAMFKLGTLYRDRLQNYEKAVAVLEDLCARYPNSNYELDAWYYLYLCYTDLNNDAKARHYHDRILDRYPTTNYARILKDPSFASKYLNEELQLNLQYDEIYGNFSKGLFADVYKRSEKALAALMGKHPLKPKYALLMAMCSGNLRGKDAYVGELQKVIATYPDTDEQRRAKEILRLLGASGGAKLPGGANDIALVASKYKEEDKEPHYILIVFKDANVSMESNKTKVSDYNQEFHKLDKLRISNMFLGKEKNIPVLVMRRFNNKEDAMKYYNGVKLNADKFIPTATAFEVLAVGQNNYRQLLTEENLDVYKAFFEEVYLK